MLSMRWREADENQILNGCQLVLKLAKAKREEKLEPLYKDPLRAKLLILDELGYVPLDIEGARLLFQGITDFYERKSFIIITNIEFGK